jgi:Flp pilus assembly protein TadB
MHHKLDLALENLLRRGRMVDGRPIKMLLLNALVLLVVMLVAKWLTGLFIFLLLAVVVFFGVVALVVIENKRKRGV